MKSHPVISGRANTANLRGSLFYCQTLRDKTGWKGQTTRNTIQATNLQTAQAIVQSPDRYHGLLLDWARLYLSAHTATEVLQMSGAADGSLSEGAQQWLRS